MLSIVSDHCAPPICLLHAVFRPGERMDKKTAFGYVKANVTGLTDDEVGAEIQRLIDAAWLAVPSGAFRQTVGRLVGRCADEGRWVGGCVTRGCVCADFVFVVNSRRAHGVDAGTSGRGRTPTFFERGRRR